MDAATPNTLPPIEITISNEQRAGLALALASNWAGGAESLIGLLDVYEACGIGEIERCVLFHPTAEPMMFQPPAGWEALATRTVALSRGGAHTLLQFYPPAQTPARLGPAKARLIKAVQEALAATKP
jgi:hypothetical protein